MSSIKMKRFVSIKGVIDKLTTSSPAPPSANPANSDRVALETHIIENMNGSQASSIINECNKIKPNKIIVKNIFTVYC